jgi:hypothetical protein
MLVLLLRVSSWVNLSNLHASVPGQEGSAVLREAGTLPFLSYLQDLVQKAGC